MTRLQHRRSKVVPSEAQNFSRKKTVHIPIGEGFTGALCERAEVKGGGRERRDRIGKVNVAEEGIQANRRGRRKRLQEVEMWRRCKRKLDWTKRHVRMEDTYDLSPVFSRVSSSRLLDLLTAWRTWSTTSDPWRQTSQHKRLDSIANGPKIQLLLRKIQGVNRFSTSKKY